MNSELIKKENNEVTLKITISSEEFEKAVNKAYDKLKGKFNIPGFRKGKAPKKLIEAQYGKGVFYDEAINIVFPEAYTKAVDENNLEPVDRPELDIEEIGNGKDLILSVKVTVKPEVKLGEYKGIEVEKIEYTVKEEDVEARLEEMRNQNARLITVEDRAVQDKDTVIIDFEGFVDGEAFEGGKGENYSLVIGSGTFIPGFEDQLIGANIGDEVKVNVTFPEQYHAENLAGKPAVFEVKVKEIKVKEMPELDDEFAKDVSEFDTLEELKNDIKNKLEETAKNREEAELRNKVVEKATEVCEVEIPEVMIENQINNMLRDFDQQLQMQGLNLQSYIQYTGMKMEDLKSQMREEAQNRVKTSLVLEAISAEEKIEVSDEELNKEMEEMANMYKMELDKFKATIREEDMDYFKENVAVKKTIDMLVENAKIA
ncbi:trigger factor [Tepidibacter formicigenes]|jgi:trigger factor|uniref:Trigger factor n=1 Tax=Tepidibacter formicigenes DSM 15518 TaxID=1123349 RepID=A0A1M6MFB9_9FIRM|nr:trigger factor [Tepidibacter formicigenes]SHJ82128.1 trigger factor [Tepidibacter formicigenes DSM 15518]